jgi:hypothetical protein
MIDPTLLEQIRLTEIEEGFEIAFFKAAMFFDLTRITVKELETIEIMQRWQLLYKEEYESLCRHHGIDYSIYEDEKILIEEIAE